MTIAAGIDVGTGAVKAALFRVENGESDWLSRATLRIRQRDPMELARVAFDQMLGGRQAAREATSTTWRRPARARACRSTPGISIR